jgi:D-arabinose 1-dehydrogenase-like Zn-dependent alcohol dehydrogenase
VIKLDDKLEPEDVAALADAGLTAYHVVAKAARILRPGDYCVMIGAGGVSSPVACRSKRLTGPPSLDTSASNA